MDAMESRLNVVVPGLPWAVADARPAREYATVFFRDPVKVGNKILIGKYVIEHDNERMAQGRPCTHIYAADDRRLPVVAFHCVHLDRAAGPRATVTLQRLPDAFPRMFKMVEFKFEESAEGHGVPSER